MSNAIIIICIYTFIIHLTESLVYTMRYAGIKTKQIAIVPTCLKKGSPNTGGINSLLFTFRCFFAPRGQDCPKVFPRTPQGYPKTPQTSLLLVNIFSRLQALYLILFATASGRQSTRSAVAVLAASSWILLRIRAPNARNCSDLSKRMRAKEFADWGDTEESQRRVSNTPIRGPYRENSQGKDLGGFKRYLEGIRRNPSLAKNKEKQRKTLMKPNGSQRKIICS